MLGFYTCLLFFHEGIDNTNKPYAVGKLQSNNGIGNYEKVGSHCVHYGLNYFLNNDDIAQKIYQYGGLENKTFILIVSNLMGFVS